MGMSLPQLASRGQARKTHGCSSPAGGSETAAFLTRGGAAIDDAVASAAARLIFLLSSERSGSTLTRVILGAHSRIVAPLELHMLRYPSYATWRREKAVAIESLIDFFQLIDQPRSAGEIDACCRDFTTEQVYEWMRSALPPGKMLLDKTPAYSSEGETLRRSVPLGPFYIWLIRHPLGVIESQVRLKRQAETKQAGVRARGRHALADVAARLDGGMTALAREREVKWLVQQTIVHEFLATVPPERKTMVQFEHLIADPAAVVARLCEAIGVPFEPAMLDPEQFGVLRARGSHADLADPTFHTRHRIESDAGNNWRGRYAESWLTRETRRLMDRLGLAES